MKLTSFFALALALSANSVWANQADDFANLTAPQALEKSHEYHGKGTASIQVFPDHILAKFNDGSQTKIPTGEQHLLSIAPYEYQTHPCGFHVPTGCQGELVEKSMQVKITDLDTKQVLKYGMVKTQKDGFIDFWMPKGKKNLEFTFTYNGKTVTQILSTEDDAKTCITTMQLS
ncbi:CueP family metal-binding protein [Vibrio hibernica]|uniref:CueP family metal-binding protein n=1 Tax=Vibrio hibernica TaxID=2587465 RepID=UPI00187FA7D9|nr:CueP family metal-binding protein [Vibrio hibernica]